MHKDADKEFERLMKSEVKTVYKHTTEPYGV